MKDYETIESGMTFGPYDKNDVFRIEKSELYFNNTAPIFHGEGTMQMKADNQ